MKFALAFFMLIVCLLSAIFVGTKYVNLDPEVTGALIACLGFSLMANLILCEDK